MKGRTIVLDHLDGREAAALLVDGQLDDLLDRRRPAAAPAGHHLPRRWPTAG